MAKAIVCVLVLGYRVKVMQVDIYRGFGGR